MTTTMKKVSICVAYGVVAGAITFGVENFTGLDASTLAIAFVSIGMILGLQMNSKFSF